MYMYCFLILYRLFIDNAKAYALATLIYYGLHPEAPKAEGV